MPRGRPPGSRNRVKRADADVSVLAGVRGLVERVAVLEAENKKLRQLLDEISRSLRLPAKAAPAAAATDATGARRRGRPRKAATPPRQRRKITDPEVLEKRRSALAKARAVRAEKLAAAKG